MTAAVRVIDHIRQKVYGQPDVQLRPAMLETPPTETVPLACIDRATHAQIRHHRLSPWVHAMQGPSMLTKMVERLPRVDRLVTTALAVQAASSLQMALGSLRVTEQCGRVYLVAFEPQERRSRDPELPLVLFNLGSDYALALRKLAQQILLYHDFTDRTFARRWWSATEKCVHKCLAALEEVAHLLTVPELCYMALMLQAPLAWPQGHQEVVPGSSRVGWGTI